MPYKHRIVEALSQLIKHYGGAGQDPFLRAVWYGIKHEVPAILQALDNNEEAIALIEEKIKEALGIAPEPVPKPEEEVIPELEEAPPSRKRRKEMEADGKVETKEERKGAISEG